MQDEADTKKLLAWCWENGIKTAVPKVTDSVMEFYEIVSMNCLEPGFMGILEPNSTCPLSLIHIWKHLRRIAARLKRPTEKALISII